MRPRLVPFAERPDIGEWSYERIVEPGWPAFMGIVGGPHVP